MIKQSLSSIFTRMHALIIVFQQFLGEFIDFTPITATDIYTTAVIYNMEPKICIFLLFILLTCSQPTTLNQTNNPHMHHPTLTSKVDQIISSINDLDQQHSTEHVKPALIPKIVATLPTPLCPSASASSSQPIHTGKITLGSSSQPLGKVSNYFVPFQQAQRDGRQSLASVSMNSFNLMFKNAISFKIQKTQSNQTGFTFEFTSQNNNLWSNMKLTFIATRRSDLEIGTASFDLNNKFDTPGYLSYKLVQPWRQTSSLKIVSFLSAFTSITTGQSIGFLINDHYVQKNILIIKYSPHQNTTISKISLDLVIFDIFNRAFRFEYGLFSQTFLTSSKTTSLPPMIDGEERIHIAGLRDFVIQTSIQLSLITSTQAAHNSTLFKYGPLSDGCFFNYLSISYLFLSINPCGFCKGSYFIYNQTCYGKCPHGTKPAPGSKCTPIICQKGTYLSQNNECNKCPKRSNILACDNACPESQYLQGQECHPKCNSSLFETYFKGKCICADGYYNISGICGQCMEGTSYNIGKQSCVSICLLNQHYNLGTHSCQCKQGMYYIGIRCGICPQSHNYVKESRSCISKCKTPELYVNGSCVCPINSTRALNQTCIYCPQGTKFDHQSQSCKSVCSDNQIWVGTQCICKPGYYQLGQECGRCPQSQIYNPTLKKCRLPCLDHQIYNNFNDSCYCKPTFNLYASQCICPELSAYNLVLDRCICQSGYSLSSSLSYTCLSVCRDNETFQNDRCVCKKGFYLIDGQCQACPSGTIYDPSIGICHPPCSTNQHYDLKLQKCHCIPGYVVINGVCGLCDKSETYDVNHQKCISKCPEIYQIYNISSGLCQCAPGYYLVKNQCQVCPEGQFLFIGNAGGKCYKQCDNYSKFSPITLKCQCIKGTYNISGVCSPCSQNMIYSQAIQQCVCIEGYGLNNGKCIVCGPYSQINVFTRKCECAPGFFLIEGVCRTCPVGTVYNYQTQSCLISCPQNSTYNVLKSRCECLAGYYMDYDNNKCIQACPHGQYFTNGQCKCINPRQVLYKGKCLDPLNCPINSYFHVESYCCLCKAGFRLNNGSCIQFTCGDHSYDYNGICVCKKGFYMIHNECKQCRSNEVYNGFQCVCLEGYTKNQRGQCVTLSIPLCKQNEIYNYTLSQCICTSNYQYVLGKCQRIPQCPTFSNWNGVSCVCQSGYVMLGNICQKVNDRIPSCPPNSQFNGVSCNCKEGYYQIKPGSCGICPQGSYWNGHQCSLTTICDIGFVISPFNGQCIPVGQLCGPGAKWNGVSCCCLPGYNNIGNNCVQCPAGTYFDGKACSSSPNAASHCSSNEIYINGQCSCIQGFYRIKGVCTECPQFTYWNGAYCECPISDPSKWCLGIPFSIQTQLGCQCQSGYFNLDGLCVQY